MLKIIRAIKKFYYSERADYLEIEAANMFRRGYYLEAQTLMGLADNYWQKYFTLCRQDK